jgi:hypothetical protein
MSAGVQVRARCRVQILRDSERNRPGKTVCLGTRLAKLELKLIASMFLLGYNYSVVDKTGQVPDPLPRPNWNDPFLCRPPAKSCYIKFERSNTPL